MIDHESLPLLVDLDKALAYDAGALDSCECGSDLPPKVVASLKAMDEKRRNRLLCTYARLRLTDEAIEQGYGLQDVRDFTHWLVEHSIPF